MRPPLTWHRCRPRRYADALRQLASSADGAGWRTVLLSSDDKGTYDELPPLLPELTFTWVPHRFFFHAPSSGAVVAAKRLEQFHGRTAEDRKRRAAASNAHQRPGGGELGVPYDEAMVLMASAQLIAEARAVVGTLTSNFGLLLHDLATRHHNGTNPFVDLDDNPYYSCNVRTEPPWGPLRGRASSASDRTAMAAYQRALARLEPPASLRSVRPRCIPTAACRCSRPAWPFLRLGRDVKRRPLVD